jgi:hypothetical protein
VGVPRGRPGTRMPGLLPGPAVGQLPAARYASITSSFMRPRGETVQPLAAAQARTAAVSTPLKAAGPVAVPAFRRPRRGCADGSAAAAGTDPAALDAAASFSSDAPSWAASSAAAFASDGASEPSSWASSCSDWWGGRRTRRRPPRVRSGDLGWPRRARGGRRPPARSRACRRFRPAERSTRRTAPTRRRVHHGGVARPRPPLQDRGKEGLLGPEVVKRPRLEDARLPGHVRQRRAGVAESAEHGGGLAQGPLALVLPTGPHIRASIP